VGPVSDDDETGTLGEGSPAQVAGAAGLVPRGAVFSLNRDLELPSPGLFFRGPPNMRGGVGSTANALALK